MKKKWKRAKRKLGEVVLLICQNRRRIKSREQRAKSREQRAESREQRAESREARC
jgi:hypothetical protein